jgi:hypothetical protein
MILMFISAVALFILPLKFKIDHHYEELYILCRWIEGLFEMELNTWRIFPANIFILYIFIE